MSAHVPKRFVSITLRKSASGCSSKNPESAIPALLTRTSIRPLQLSRTFSTAAVILTGEQRSSSMRVMRFPASPKEDVRLGPLERSRTVA